MAEDLGERTEAPTAKRRGEAREKGQIGKSIDLSAVIILTASLLGLKYFGGDIFESMGALTALCLSSDWISTDLSGKRLTTDIWLAFGQAGRVLLPVVLLVAFAAYLSGVSQVGLLFSTKILRPNFGKLNFIKGLGKFGSVRTLVKGTLDISKFSVVAIAATLVVVRDFHKVAALPSLELMAGMVMAGRMIVDLVIWILVILLILGLLDLWYQKWQVRKDLRMTKHEVKDERKASEGDMETKARRLRMARQVAMQRLQADVPKADVIVTNPTHYSVAIKYDADTMRAPKVVAKGADYLALKIRYIAAAHAVPIVERPPLARALYAGVPVGAEISAEHYEAVAEVLAYIYRLEGRAVAAAAS